MSEINVKKYPEKLHSAATEPPNYPTMNFKKPLRLRKEINRNFLFGVAMRLSPEGKKVFFDRKNEEKNPKKEIFFKILKVEDKNDANAKLYMKNVK